LSRYLLQVIKSDRSLTVRRHVASALSESILLSLAVGDVYMPNTNSGIVDNAETEESRKQRAESHNKAIVKALRRDFADKAEFLSMMEALLL
jgi:transcription initiation factor TFIID subunit 2